MGATGPTPSARCPAPGGRAETGNLGDAPAGPAVRLRWTAALLLLGCVAPLSAQDGATDAGAREAVVRSFLTSYYDALSDRDWPRFAAHFWPGATIGTVWQPPGEPAPRVDLQTVATFVERAPEGPGSKPIFEERMLDAEVHVRGNLALVYARYRARFGDENDVTEWEGLDAFTLLEHQGEWRITALTFASD